MGTQGRFNCVALLLLAATARHVSSEAVYISKCAAGCDSHGTCNEELGRCDCPRDKMGPDCAMAVDTKTFQDRCAKHLFVTKEDCGGKLELDCLNKCNRRGTCLSGFCNCTSGFWGSDCSLSWSPKGKPQLLGGTNWTTRTKRPWVYVYELPPSLTTWGNTIRLDRPTHHVFWQRLLSSGARTADPEQADWFFIPIRQRGMGDTALLAEAIQYVDKTWPYWKRHQGSRHIMIHTGDLGVEEADQKALKLTENMTWLTHWGLYKPHKYSGWIKAHRIGQDVVIPVYVSPGHFRPIGMDKSPLHPNYNSTGHGLSRTNIFFFAGRICGDRKPPNKSRAWPDNCGEPVGYSGGMRQAIHSLYYNRTGWRVAQRERRYDRMLSSSRFCLAPLGGGHGQRQITVSFMGCIPVTIGDNVMQPFEPELDWSRFSLQPAESQVAQLHTIVESVDDKQIARMQTALRCAAQHFVWSSATGGFMNESGRYDAFETILEILRVKLAHPTAKPEEYNKLDDDFRRFMACGAEELGDDPPPEPIPQKLCSHSVLEGVKPGTCYRCIRGSSLEYGLPGGTICCGKGSWNLAKCHRTWA